MTFNCGRWATIDISVGTGTKTITTDTTIDGGGMITISGEHSTGVFAVNPGVNFTVRNMTIADGRASEGGGIQNSGLLTVTNSTFTDNSADQSGGGIFNLGGMVAVTNCTFTLNDAEAGGAVDSLGDGPSLTVTNSTFTG